MLRPIVCTAALLLVGAARGVVINVGPGQSIQAAINSASNGDVIVVAPATHHEKIDFLGKAVTVTSSGGPAVTVIDASGLQASVVSCKNNEGLGSVLDGFTVRGGIGSVFLSKRVGGGMFNNLAEPTVRNCIFTQNSADEGGGMWNRGRDPVIIDCVFVGNTAPNVTGLGGGGMFNQLADPTLINCLFAGNSALNSGGGMIYTGTSNSTLINCQFHGNTAGTAAALYYGDGNLTLVNCTVSDNTASFWGGGAALVGSNAAISNCIFWDNSPEQIYVFGGTTTVDHSDVMGGWAGGGSNNMNADPMFVDPAGGDYRLAPASPCVNHGDSSAVPPEVTSDLDGNQRIVAVVDLGPYELQAGVPCPWDLDGDGSTGVTDMLELLLAWGTAPGGPPDFDGNGSVGISDFLDLMANWGACP